MAEKRNTEEKTSAQGKESNKEAETIKNKRLRKNDPVHESKNDRKQSKSNRKERSQLLKSVKDKDRPELINTQKENARKTGQEDICPKCHHKKGRRKSKNPKQKNINPKNVDDSDLSQRIKKEEKEIPQRYIKETLSADHFCTCSNHGPDNKSLTQRKDFKMMKDSRNEQLSKFDF